MKKFLQWLDKYLLSIWALFLLFFIPLYPKVPLLDVLPGYIVRVRLEDFFILIGLILTWREVVKRKPDLKKTPLFKPIIIYLLIGLASSLSAIFITKTVPLEDIHVAKLFFHWARRAEYFSLFFIFYFGFKNLPKKVKSLVFLPILMIVASVAIYGFGQKYLYWPVFLTMNREFSKGMKLYLTEHARVSSTFGGHYDLAAFLVIVLPLILALFYSNTKKLIKFLFFLGFGAGFWLLILTASRTSFIAYLLAVVVFFVFTIFKKGFFWSLFRGIVIIGTSLLVMVFFGDLSSRYAHFVAGIKKYPVICLDPEANTKPFVLFEESALPGRKSNWEKKEQKTASESAVCRTIITINKLVDFEKLAQKIEENQWLAKLRERLKSEPKIADISVVTETDQLPEPVKPATTLPPDVYEDIPNKEVTVSAATATEPAKTTVTYTPRTYSENAYKYGLSVAIRLDALWPRAWEGFKRNPLLGSGYSTLTKVKLTDFTEAESTDNDYLRMLGETGLLGFLSFMGILVIALVTIFVNFKQSKDISVQLISASFMAFIAGLLLNAIYIDIFEASKVAYTLWGLLGIYMATQIKSFPKRKNEK